MSLIRTGLIRLSLLLEGGHSTEPHHPEAVTTEDGNILPAFFPDVGLPQRGIQLVQLATILVITHLLVLHTHHHPILAGVCKLAWVSLATTGLILISGGVLRAAKARWALRKTM